MRYSKRRGISEILGVLLMLAIVVSIGVLLYVFTNNGLANVGESLANVMGNQANAMAERYRVEQVVYNFGSVASLSIDGSATGTFTGTNTGTASLTTTTSNDVIVVLVTNENAPHALVDTVSAGGVTSTGLTFTKRSSVSLGAPTYQEAEVWYAVASSPLTAATITVALGTACDDATIIAFGVAGANTASPWDPNVSLPATATGAAGTTPTIASLSTTNANDMILGFQGNGDAGGVPATVETAGGSAVLIRNVDNEGGTNAEDGAAQYQVVGSAQTGIPFAFGTATSATNGDAWMMIGDAIQASTIPVQGADVYVRNVGTIPITLVSVYVVDQSSNAFVTQVGMSTGVVVGSVVSVSHATITFTPTHGHTYSFTVTTSRGNSMIYSARAS